MTTDLTGETEPQVTEDVWFEELQALSASKGLPSGVNRERWITHYHHGRTPEQAIRYVLGDEAFDRLCRQGVYCQGLCQCPDHHH